MKITWNAEIRSPDGAHDMVIPATVPGCIHADLMKNSLIPDPYWRDNNEQLQWIENCDVTYTGVFTLDFVSADSYLVFRGLDVYATVFCNGKVLGKTDNMHISWEYDVTEYLQAGENTLTVAFRSPIREVAGLPLRKAAFAGDRLYTRRVQCSYGWDWLGRFVTMGIWKPVELIVRHADYIGDREDGIYIYTDNVNPYSAQVGIELNFTRVTGNAWVSLEILSPEGEVIRSKRRRILQNTVKELIDVQNPRLWYPSGYGEQPLYSLRIRTYAAEEAEEWNEERRVTFGIRTVKILELEDAPDSYEAGLANRLKECPHLQRWDRNEGSSGFWLLINDVRVFCLGANWVPSEPFPSEETPEKLAHLVRMAKDAGVNMLRVWGGGVFAPKALMQACDRAGILVTQDFLMACGTYPEEDPAFLEQLRREAEEAARMLRNHPSLVWWSGDNENAVRGDENLPAYDGRLAALVAIGPQLERLDPHRKFLPSSPYGGVPYASGVRGTTHNTQYLSTFFAWVREGNWSDYRAYFDTYLARFTAEQPVIGMPFVSSLRRFMTEADIFGENTEISEYHTKNNPALGAITLYGYVERMASGLFGDFRDGEDRIRKMQWLQCEWIRISMELFRRNAWYSSGILHWMWNDCWPAANGWSMVDYYGNAKPSFYAFKRCAKPLMASISLKDAVSGKACVRVSLAYHGKAGERATGECRLYRYHIHTGTEDYVTVLPFSVDTGSVTLLYDGSPIPMDENTVLLADVTSDRGQDRAFCLPAGKSYADMTFVYGDATVLEQTEKQISVCATETLPYAFIDPNDVLLKENGVFLKKGERYSYAIVTAEEKAF